MLQIYFLSFFLNAAGGYLLVTGGAEENIDLGAGLSTANETLRFVLGILSSAIGVLKLLSSIEGDMPVLGDIIPALGGLLTGTALLLEYYRRRSTLDTDGGGSGGSLGDLFLRNKRIIGFAGLASAVLHFLFPRVLFL